MRWPWLISGLLVVLSAAGARADGPPITFARSGSKAVVTIEPINLPSMQLALRAYGRVWTTAIARNEKDMFLIEFEVPAVRVPTVFSVTHADLQNPELAQVVAYPDRDIAWDKKIALYSSGTPAWFDQWASATGLPVKPIKPDETATLKPGPGGEDARSLLILGPSAAGGDLAHVVKLAKEKAVRILVLDADWFGDATGPVDVGGGQMRGDLLALTGKQSWASMLEFRSHRQPCGAIGNRWAWIPDRDGLPLVEAMAVIGKPLTATHPVALNYLPWAEQLGRKEQADELLCQIVLAAVSSGLTPRDLPPPRAISMIWPPPAEVTAADRPVLAAAIAASQEGRLPGGTLSVLDLRSKESPPQSVAESLAKPPAEGARLLILGDDPVLDRIGWLKLDRDKKTLGASGVRWLPDDTLPPPSAAKVRLMEALTESGVSLSHTKEADDAGKN